MQYYDRATALLQTDVLLVLEAFKLKDVGETNLDGLQIYKLDGQNLATNKLDDELPASLDELVRGKNQGGPG